MIGGETIRRAGTAFGLGVCLIAVSGCITVAKVTRETGIDRAAVASLEEGTTTVPEALERLGAPLEAHLHPDGLILVYRHEHQNSFNWSVGVSQAVRFIDATQVVAEILGNLSFTKEDTHTGQDRLVLLFDRARVLEAIGIAWVTDELP